MIYIVRHGQTEKNKANVLQGRSDVPLNEVGIRQAEDVAACVVLAPGAQLDESALRDHCRGLLARYKVPQRFIAMETLAAVVSRSPCYAAAISHCVVRGAGINYTHLRLVCEDDFVSS